MSSLKIEHLSDYDAVRRLRNRLHRRIGGQQKDSAAILIGSGFSHNAEPGRSDAAQFPSWQAIAQTVRERLGESDDNSPLGTAEMLALFQMFEEVVGRAALEELINAYIPDGQFMPGELHERLLSLPWNDVFTTNWDTLIERAAAGPNVQRRYSIVTQESDLSRAAQPRIVKLHGGLPNVGQLIITEEDYRRYPEQHAAFVDVTRTSLMVNAFCLVGFSAGDPNFIQWHGWVRDRLAKYANRPTLVVVDKISRGRRLYLESKGLTIVDLSPLVDHYCEEPIGESPRSFALRQFIEALEDRRDLIFDWPKVVKSKHADQKSPPSKPPTTFFSTFDNSGPKEGAESQNARLSTEEQTKND